MCAGFRCTTTTWWQCPVETDKALHNIAREGFARSGDLYERARSGYPDHIAQRLFKHLGAKPGARVLELAAGTGKWTQQLVKAGFEVTALEPSAEMRSVLEKQLPGTLVVDGLAEQIPFPTEYFDFVFVATAFHWFDSGPAYREISRVLKPGGGLGLLWTARDPAVEPAWYADILRLLRPFEAGAPRYRHMKWRQPFDFEIDFKMLQFENHDVSRPRTTTEIVERMLSISYIAALPELVYLGLKRQMEEVLAAHILRGQIFKLPEEIHLYWTRKEI